MQISQRPFIFLRYICILFIFQSAIGQGPAHLDNEVQALTMKYDSLWKDGLDTVVLTGSSSIRMWKLPSKTGNTQFINTGFGGSTVRDLLQHLGPLVLHFDPSIVIVYEGDNDLASGLSPKRVCRRMKRLCRKIKRKAPGAEIIFLAAKPSPQRWHLRTEFQRYNELLAQLADALAGVKFIDTWTPLLDNSGNLRPNLYLQDGLHLGPGGYRIWNSILKKETIL